MARMTKKLIESRKADALAGAMVRADEVGMPITVLLDREYYADHVSTFSQRSSAPNAWLTVLPARYLPSNEAYQAYVAEHGQP